MTMFPFVKKGDEFKPNVSLDNACRSFFNSFQSSSTPGSKRMFISHTVLQCYNTTDETIPAGSSVCFDDTSAILNDLLPIKICDNVSQRWGVAEYGIDPGCVGDVIFSGVAKIPFVGYSKYVTPDLNGGYKDDPGGLGEVIYKSSQGESFVFLKDENTGYHSSYNGPFAFSIDSETKQLKISAGFLNRNGKFFTVSETTIDVLSELSASPGPDDTESEETVFNKSKYICVTSKFDTESNTFNDPKIEIADPSSDAYPIGSCTVLDKTRFSYECYQIPMAIIVYTKECPLAAKYNR